MWSIEIQDAVRASLLECVKRRRLVFVQANPAVDAMLRRALDEGALVSGDLASDAGGGPPLFLDSFDADVFQATDPARALGVARERVLSILDEGRDVCLVSKAPRIAFPQCPGSSLLDDAYVFHADSAVRAVTADQSHEREVTVAWSDSVDHAQLEVALEMLGLDALACLDYLLFDLQQTRQIALELASEGEWEALRGCGLVSFDVESGFASFALSPAILMPRVAEVISRSLGVQPAYPPVTTSLVDIERRIRRCLRVRAIAAFGEKWRAQALVGDQDKRILDRVTADAGMRPASVKSLRDPLEWLSLGELLEIVQTAPWTQRLGHERELWNRFASEVMPIRNRVSHMRLLRRGDLERVRYWCLALSKTLKTQLQAK